jgi:hypothetical protein
VTLVACIAVLMATAWAMFAPIPRRLYYYLACQLFATLGFWASSAIAGTYSQLYLITFFLLTSTILYAGFVLCWEAVSHHPYHWSVVIASGAVGIVVSWFVWSSLQKQDLYHLIPVIEGAALVWSFCTMGMALPYVNSEDRGWSATLAAMWAARSAFDLGLPIYYPNEFWAHQLNMFVPPILCIWAFAWIGWRQREKFGLRRGE